MKADNGGLSLKQWCAVLGPVLLYLLLGLGLRTLLLWAGLDEASAGTVSACSFPIPAAIWYYCKEANGPRAGAAACPRMAVEIIAVTLCLALTAAWASRWTAVPASPGSALTVLGFGVAGPVTEEILYRGIVLRRCNAYFGTGWAVFLSTVLFGFAHQPAANVCVSLAAGLAFGLLCVRWHTLLAPIVAHVGVNLLYFVQLEQHLPEGVLLFGMLALVAFLAWMALACFRDKKK